MKDKENIAHKVWTCVKIIIKVFFLVDIRKYLEQRTISKLLILYIEVVFKSL